MPDSPSLLFVLSAAYPFGTGEVFLENELPYLAEAFDEVIIFPMFSEGKQRELPTAQAIEVVPPEPGTTSRKAEFLRGIEWSEGLFFREWRRAPGFPFSASVLYRVARTLGIARRIRHTLLRYAKARELPQNGAGITIYSYWMMQACLGGILAGKQLGAPVVSRAHGGDLYTERYARSYLPWQEWKLRQLTGVLPVAQAGADYLQQRYPAVRSEIAGKMRVSRLGVRSRGQLRHRPGEVQRRRFHLVSCSSVYDLKRVPHIYEVFCALRRLLPDSTLRWTHIGDGAGFNDLLERLTQEIGKPATEKGFTCFRICEPEAGQTDEIRLTGNLPNARIIPYYIEEEADVFINYSTSEGIPVSIMEAFSAGIPAAAPDVGGIHELMGDGTEAPRLPAGGISRVAAGLLFSADAPPQRVAEAIAGLYKENAWPDKGRAAREKWAAEYDADANYKAFARFLKEIKR